VKKKGKTSAKGRRRVKARRKEATAARRDAPQQAPRAKRPGKKRGPKPGTNLRFNWAAVNWGLRDADIARSLGVSRERVRQVRKEKGLAPSSEIGRDLRTPNRQRVGRPPRSRGIGGAPVVLRAYRWDEAKWR
jgi:hypothetical protein